ncbi:unnamed protein product, partial [Amoebophrya sp. A25]
RAEAAEESRAAVLRLGGGSSTPTHSSNMLKGNKIVTVDLSSEPHDDEEEAGLSSTLGTQQLKAQIQA